MNLLSSVPMWIVLLGAVAVGFLAFIGLFDRERNTRNKEKETLEDRVRKLYAEESAQLQEQVTKLTEEVKKLRTENEVITKVFQGRDDQTVSFQKMGFETMKQFAITNQLIAETHKLALQTKNGLEKQGKSIEKLVAALEKHLSTEAKRTAVSLPPGSEMTVKKSA